AVAFREGSTLWLHSAPPQFPSSAACAGARDSRSRRAFLRSQTPNDRPPARLPGLGVTATPLARVPRPTPQPPARVAAAIPPAGALAGPQEHRADARSERAERTKSHSALPGTRTFADRGGRAE